MAVVDEARLEMPAAGARKMAKECTRCGLPATRHAASRLMRCMGIAPVCPKPSTSSAAKGHPGFPCLLRGMRIWLPNQVWATDVTCIKMGRTHMYLTAAIDWATRTIAGWELSDTLEAAPVVERMRRAFEERGVPAVAISDQGSAYTARAYVDLLADNGVRQSMDGKARWVDNVVMKRWFRALKTEWIRINDFSTPRELREVIAEFVDTYNNRHLHASLGYRTPAECSYEPFAKAA